MVDPDGARAVLTLGDGVRDAAAPKQPTTERAVVAPVGDEALRPLARPAATDARHSDRVEHLLEPRALVHLRGGRPLLCLPGLRLDAPQRPADALGRACRPR